MSFSPSNVKVHFAGYDNDERAIFRACASSFAGYLVGSTLNAKIM